MQKREHVIHFMLQGHVHLSKKDYGFFHNLQRLVHDRGIVTTNQSNLFEKLLKKYSRQLIKLEKSPDELLNLQWNSTVVRSSEEYTGARVSIHGNSIILKCPFNTKFVKVFKNIKDNTFLWDKVKKGYESEFSTNALKIVYDTLPKYFDDVSYDDAITKKLDEILEFKNHTFAPTLKNINGNLVVVACNQTLSDLLSGIVIEKTAPCFFKMSQLGINVDPDLLTDESLKFASSNIYEMDLYDIDKLGELCQNVGVKHVVWAYRASFSQNINLKSIMHKLERYGVESIIGANRLGIPDEKVNEWLEHEDTIFIQYHSSNYIKNKFVAYSKYVVLKNSTVIHVK